MRFKGTFPTLIAMISLMVNSASGQGNKTGIEGYIFRISGNQMPSPSIKPTPPKGIKSVLYIYELTSFSQVNRQGGSGFYSSIHTRLVQSVASNDQGYFFAYLPPGEYSLFTKKDALFYANNFDGNNHIAPVKVISGQMTQVHVNVDYDAVY